MAYSILLRPAAIRDLKSLSSGVRSRIGKAIDRLLHDPRTSGSTQYYNGRLASVTLPTGGEFQYSYSGGNHGINCADGTTPTLTRTTPDGVWTYVHSENGSAWSTKVTDPQSNYTLYSFQGLYETQRGIYNSSSNLLETVSTCYNGASIPCNSTSITLPIANRTAQVTLPGLSASKTCTTYNTYGLPTETDEYTYGPTLVRKTIPAYTSCGVTNPYVLNRPCSIKVYDGGGVERAETDNSYSPNGNLLTESHSTGRTPPTINRTFTYNPYGVLQTATDFLNSPNQESSVTSCACAGVGLHPNPGDLRIQ